MRSAATTTTHFPASYTTDRGWREVGNFRAALRARTASDSLLLTSGAGVAAQGRRDVQGVNPNVGAQDFSEKSRSDGKRKDMKGVYVPFSASKKQKRAWHQLGLGACEALRWPGRGPGRAPQALSLDPGTEGAGCKARGGRAQGGSGVGVPGL